MAHYFSVIFDLQSFFLKNLVFFFPILPFIGFINVSVFRVQLVIDEEEENQASMLQKAFFKNVVMRGASLDAQTTVIMSCSI